VEKGGGSFLAVGGRQAWREKKGPTWDLEVLLREKEDMKTSGPSFSVREGGAALFPLKSSEKEIGLGLLHREA